MNMIKRIINTRIL